jgi:spore photoproduct lyase
VVPDALFIDRSAADHPRAAAIAGRLALSPRIIDDPRPLFQAVASDDDPEGRGKEILYLTRQRGPFLRNCPGTREYICCGYQILHVGAYCTMDCAYCILQSYFHPPVLQFFVNDEDLLDSLDALFATRTLNRVGTGEFTDSLIWEPWADLNPPLIRRFAGQSRSVLELKTKTADITPLAGLDHRRKTILAWSVNTPRVIRTEERRTAGLSARLAAAARAEALGYPVAFHFDPMILYPGCEAEYEAVVDRIFEAVSPENIVWISLGTLRFMPALKPVIERRFPDSTIVYGELIPGLDGKMRYFKPPRTALCRTVAGRIAQQAPEVTVYLCMEDEPVWVEALGIRPADRGGLSRMLDEAAARVCGLSAPP